jgi:hypothetical protein
VNQFDRKVLRNRPTERGWRSDACPFRLTHSTRTTFDTQRRLATRIEAEDTSGHGNRGTSKDLDGKTHRPADCRGKVVILDFWYRGCGW